MHFFGIIFTTWLHFTPVSKPYEQDIVCESNVQMADSNEFSDVSSHDWNYWHCGTYVSVMKSIWF